MAFLFKGRKTPADLLKAAMAGLAVLEEDSDALPAAARDSGPFGPPMGDGGGSGGGDSAEPASAEQKRAEKARDKLSQTLSLMKLMMYGDGDHEPKEADVNKLVDGLMGKDSKMLVLVVQHMRHLQFEARKDVAQIFNFVLRQRSDKAIAYVRERPDILSMLVHGYEEPEVALNSGSILREVIRHEELCSSLLNNRDLFYLFFDYVQVASFDVASDAFATFKLMLTKHKKLAAKFLEKNYEDVFGHYQTLLESNNYVTRRTGLKLLGELLLDRTNFRVMMRYINDPENLKTMMMLLRRTTKAIQYECFHVFKVFVANPQKSPPIVEILLRNRDKLKEFLTKFHTDKDDDQFAEEKRILISALDKLHEGMLKPKESGGGGGGGAAAGAPGGVKPKPKAKE